MEAWSLHMIALALIGQQRFDDGQPSPGTRCRHFHEAGDIGGTT